MPKVIWRTDVHLGDRTPRRRTGNWTEDVLAKLKWIGEKAAEIEASAVLDGGDFFDVKSPVKNSHALVRAAAEVHRDNYPCPIYCLVGNHDVKYGNPEYLPEQPLGVLFASGVFEPIGDNVEVILEGDGVKCRIVGVPYHGTSYDFERLSGIERGDEDYLLVVCHLLARDGETGTMFEGEDIVGYSFLNTVEGVDGWFFGHWHCDQGIKQLPNGATVVNVGSLTRGSLHLDNLDRSPCVVEVDMSQEGIRFIRHDLPVRAASEAFKVDEALREVEDKTRMEEIVDKMKEMTTSGWGDMTLKERVMSSPVPDRVKELASSYLEASE